LEPMSPAQASTSLGEPTVTNSTASVATMSLRIAIASSPDIPVTRHDDAGLRLVPAHRIA
jgi:hypothetical protein